MIDTQANTEWASQMKDLLGRENQLKIHLEQLALGRNKPRWRKYDSRMIIFPALSETDVQNLCFGEIEEIAVKSE